MGLGIPGSSATMKPVRSRCATRNEMRAPENITGDADRLGAKLNAGTMLQHFTVCA